MNSEQDRGWRGPELTEVHGGAAVGVNPPYVHCSLVKLGGCWCNWRPAEEAVAQTSFVPTGEDGKQDPELGALRCTSVGKR